MCTTKVQSGHQTTSNKAYVNKKAVATEKPAILVLVKFDTGMGRGTCAAETE